MGRAYTDKLLAELFQANPRKIKMIYDELFYPHNSVISFDAQIVMNHAEENALSDLEIAVLELMIDLDNLLRRINKLGLYTQLAFSKEFRSKLSKKKELLGDIDGVAITPAKALDPDFWIETSTAVRQKMLIETKQLFDWLIKQDGFNRSFKLFNQKNWFVWNYSQQEQNSFPYKNDDEEKNIKFKVVCASALLIRLKFFVYSVESKVKPTSRLESLSNKLLKEFDSLGVQNAETVWLKKIAMGKEDLVASFKLDSNEIRKTIVKEIANSMHKHFSFKSTQKGRPYVDVVQEIVRMVGFEISLRQMNRELKPYDRDMTE